MKDATYESIVCISTLEHVGADTSRYGRESAAGGDAVVAARELRRVLQPRGRVWLSVPFGRAADLGWLRVVDGAYLAHILDALKPTQVD
jgi:hypothetical protein